MSTLDRDLLVQFVGALTGGIVALVIAVYVVRRSRFESSLFREREYRAACYEDLVESTWRVVRQIQASGTSGLSRIDEPAWDVELHYLGQRPRYVLAGIAPFADSVNASLVSFLSTLVLTSQRYDQKRRAIRVGAEYHRLSDSTLADIDRAEALEFHRISLQLTDLLRRQFSLLGGDGTAATTPNTVEVPDQAAPAGVPVDRTEGVGPETTPASAGDLSPSLRRSARRSS